jgi:hypothetical protein
MEQLPQIVRQRLRTKGEGGVHPDPNLLTAFAENLLSELERASVQGHLANCADCREIVTLALPQMELEGVAAAAVAPPIHAPWFFRPGLRWGALAACALVAGAGFLYYHASEKRVSLVALQKSAPAPVAQPLAEKDQAAGFEDQVVARADQKEESAAPARDKHTDEEKIALSAAPPSPALKQRMASNSVATKSSENGERKKMAAAVALATSGKLGESIAVEPQPDLSKTDVSKTKTEPLFSAKSKNPQPMFDGRVESQGREQGQTSVDEIHGTAIAGALPSAPAENKPVVTNGRAQAASLPPLQAPGGLRADAAATRPPANSSATSRNYAMVRQAAAGPITPRWTISSDGTMLLRSLDAGRTWQPIPVGNSVVFRAIAALGSEVWVGGVHAALYHSSDTGQHWVQVRPSAGGESLAADIVRVEFPDLLHGTLTTANGRVWTTSDGGQTWQQK